MKNETSKNLVWDVLNYLRDLTYSRNYTFSALRVLFLKYAIDNYIGTRSAEDMQACSRAQKMFAMRDVAGGIGAVIAVMEYIDHAYGLNHILSHSENIDMYNFELFGVGQSRKSRTYSEANAQHLLGLIGSLDLEEHNNQPLGRELVQELLAYSESSFSRNSFSGDHITHSSINTLVRELLHVQDSDTFLDFTAGTGISTLKICENAMPAIVSAEIDPVNAASAAMLYIMYGFKNIRVSCQDSLSFADPDIRGNKLFVDPPVGMKLSRKPETVYTDSTLAALHGIMESYLTTPGEAVMTCSGAFMFQSKKQTVDLRAQLVSGGMLKAVITLPPLGVSTATNVHLLLIEKTVPSQQNDVLFIDTTRELKSGRYRNAPKNTLPEQLISKVVSCVSEMSVIPGFSCLVSMKTIHDTSFNLVPATYLPTEADEDTMTMEEVDTQLAELYQRLQEFK